MISLPVTSKYESLNQEEVITIDFDREVIFNPNGHSDLAKFGHWSASDDLSKYSLVYDAASEFPDKTINKVLGDLNLNGYELIHGGKADDQ